MEEAIECLRYIEKTITREDERLTGFGCSFSEREKILHEARQHRDNLFEAIMKRMEMNLGGYRLIYIDGVPVNVERVT